MPLSLTTSMSTSRTFTTSTTSTVPSSTTLPCDYGCNDSSFKLLFDVFLPGICIFALMICFSRIVFAFVRHRLSRSFMERHGMTREEFIAHMQSTRGEEDVPELDEREWRRAQLAALNVAFVGEPPSYDDICKTEVSSLPTYEEASSRMVSPTSTPMTATEVTPIELTDLSRTPATPYRPRALSAPAQQLRRTSVQHTIHNTLDRSRTSTVLSEKSAKNVDATVVQPVSPRTLQVSQEIVVNVEDLV